MKAYVAVTDKGWFEHLRILSRQGRVQEVNFWTPRKWGGRFGVLDVQSGEDSGADGSTSQRPPAAVGGLHDRLHPPCRAFLLGGEGLDSTA